MQSIPHQGLATPFEKSDLESVPWAFDFKRLIKTRHILPTIDDRLKLLHLIIS